MIEGRIVPAEPVSGTQAAAALFAPYLIRCGTETMCVAHLDADLRLLRLATAAGLCAARVEVPMRTIIHDALVVGAHALILAHNHPGGGLRPSRADTHATCRLVEIARPLRIRVLDHLIFAGDEIVSFRELGLL